MSDFVNEEPESGEELIDEEGRNPTRRRIDEELSPTGEERKRWDETYDEPAQGEGGQDSVSIALLDFSAGPGDTSEV